jgi:hypothetical protein
METLEHVHFNRTFIVKVRPILEYHFKRSDRVFVTPQLRSCQGRLVATQIRQFIRDKIGEFGLACGLFMLLAFFAMHLELNPIKRV